MIKSNKSPKKQDSDGNIDNSGNILIRGNKKPWNEGTIHILWPSVIANTEDDSYVAWCRENAKGELRKPENMLPVDNEDRFCQTCLEKAKKSKNIREPDFVKDILEP
jgi:hypothetical protein